MSNRAWITIISILAIVIVVLAFILLTTPAPTNQPIATSTSPTVVATSTSATSTDTGPEPLHALVQVTSPENGATVDPSFTVSGKVPGNWSYEAQFPVQVMGPDNNKIGQATAHLNGDWETTNLVDFSANVTTSGYHGPATLVLLKDNPSGLPENDDSLEIPVVIK